MGADQSKTLPVDEWSCDDVVASIQALGDQYAGYGPLIHEKQVTGHVLANIGKDTMDVELEQLGVQSRLHRRVLVKKLLVLRGEATTAATAASDQKQRASRSLSPKRSSNRTSRSGRKPSSTNTSDDNNNNNENPPMRRASTCNPPSSSKTREPEEADKAKFWAMLEEAAEKQRRDHEALVAREATLRAQLGSFIGGVTRRVSGFFSGIAAMVAPEDLGDFDENDDDNDKDNDDGDNNNNNNNNNNSNNQNEVKQNS